MRRAPSPGWFLAAFVSVILGLCLALALGITLLVDDAEEEADLLLDYPGLLSDDVILVEEDEE